VEIQEPSPGHWLNRTVVGVSVASLCSDVSHELATAVLPAFLITLGAGPAALGFIEGTADGLSALAKLWGGVMADRLRRRKPLAATGYLLTAAGTAAIGFCTAAWQVGLCRAAAWIGRGSRGPARDVLMSEGVLPGNRGKAFGLERAADATGAVLGPLLAMALLARGVGPRHLLIVSLGPGLLAFLAMALLPREAPHEPRAARFDPLAELSAIGLPFRRYLAGILLFGCGDFSRTLLILHVTRHVEVPWLASAALGVALYMLHNAVSALVAFPIGALADAMGHRRVVVWGSALGAATSLGFASAPATFAFTLALFVSSGVQVACSEVAEKACAVELVPKSRRGAGMGLLAAANGIGDMVSSALVGSLWSLLPSPALGFASAGILQLMGAATLAIGFRSAPPAGDSD
jgi:MFS family permease